jgi:hypothetical protein
MFDKKIEIAWRRTGKKQYPLQSQVCLIYFAHTGFSVSEYEEQPDSIDYGDGNKYTVHVFVDLGGWLGDEDLLWIPIAELPAVGSFQHIVIPEDYSRDCAREKD